MITVGTMQLHQPEAPDAMEPFFVGGEYHLDMSRISSHDHSGGLLGAPVAVTIPDGSITTADLDPSVLAPYALVDGSKPFTGQVTLQADAVVRDALLFGEQGSALAPDATLTRTSPGALRVASHLGVGVAPAPDWAGRYAVQVGLTGSLAGEAAASALALSSNSTWDGTANRALATPASTQLSLGPAGLGVYTAPGVAASGAVQAFATRLTVAADGLVTLTPDAAATALSAQNTVAVNAQGGNWILDGRANGTQKFLVANNGAVTVTPDAAATALSVGGAIVSPAGVHLTLLTRAAGELRLGEGTTTKIGYFSNMWFPYTDNQVSLGGGVNRYTTLFAVAGTINTSSRDAKEGITPLDPARAMEAVRSTEAVTFDYKAPERGPEWYDLPDDPEQAEAVLRSA